MFDQTIVCLVHPLSHVLRVQLLLGSFFVELAVGIGLSY